MTTHARRFRARILCGVLCATAGMASQATTPLHDQYKSGALTGKIEAAECCWLTLPPSKRLQEIRRAEMASCSALGGPVGMFEHRDSKLWLARLYRCGGVIELGEIYPGLQGPVVADWLSGRFKATLYQDCHGKDGVRFVTIWQQLVVDKGAVTLLEEARSDAEPCPPFKPDPTQ